MTRGGARLKITVIHGSPRANGNTDYLVGLLVDALRLRAAGDEVLVEHIRAARLKARPCLACGGCDETGECIVQDDMQGVYAQIRGADLLLIASPVFFTSVTAQLKAVIDRFQCAWVAKYKLGRPWREPADNRRAALVCAGGMTVERHYRQTRSVVRAWLETLNLPLTAGLWFPGVDARGDAAKVEGLTETIAAAAVTLLTPQIPGAEALASPPESP